jgi:hypothetical protein
VQRLRGVCPTGRPVRVRRLKLPKDLLGDVDRVKGVYQIRVSTFEGWTREDLVDLAQTLILAHEWSHALSPSWAIGEDRRDKHHGAYFAAGYSQVYEAIWPTED